MTPRNNEVLRTPLGPDTDALHDKIEERKFQRSNAAANDGNLTYQIPADECGESRHALVRPVAP